MLAHVQSDKGHSYSVTWVKRPRCRERSGWLFLCSLVAGPQGGPGTLA